LRGQIQFQITIFLGVGRQFVSADIDLTPLETLPDIPDRQQAGAPRGKMVVLPLRLGHPLTTNPMVRHFAITIGTGHAESANLARAQLVAPRDRSRGVGAWRMPAERSAVGAIVQIGRDSARFSAPPQPVGAGRSLGMARDKPRVPQTLLQPWFPLWHRRGTS